jgi:NAD(P)-dependent dehydrogenase (short-subunit alcohol dehydrogenase family)
MGKENTSVGAPASPMGRFRLDGKRAIVTGASRGIGREIALAMAEAGADLALVSRRRESLDEVAREVEAIGRRAFVVPCHVGRTAEVRAVIAECARLLGGLDVLVNNAGTNPIMVPIVDLEEPAWDKIFDVNLKGPFVACQVAARIFRETGVAGSIVNVSSVGGLDSSPGLGAYCVSKAGLIMLTQVLARELGRSGVRANAIAPGLIATRLSEALMSNPAIHDAAVSRAALQRHGEAHEIAGAAVFLASDASSYMSGQTLVLDGGTFLLG